MALPPPTHDQAYCDVSALDSGFLTLPLDMFITTASSGDKLTAPSLSFLIQHSRNHKKFLFDLGMRKDLNNLTPNALKVAQGIYAFHVPQDVVESLALGNLSPADIDTVCLSHLHIDHSGDTKQFTSSEFIVGAETATLLNPGYPADPDSHYPLDILPAERTAYIAAVGWPSVGPFDRALDFYGDGSLYLIDAAGHIPGHLNALVRTSADGGWLFLTGDSVHHWSLITGESQIVTGKPGGYPSGCVHANKELAEDNIRRIRQLTEMPRVRVILAHDVPWYEENKGTSAFWPGKIPSL